MDDIKETRRDTFLNVWPYNNIFSFNAVTIFLCVRCYLDKSILILVHLVEHTSRTSYSLFQFGSCVIPICLAISTQFPQAQNQKLVI